MFGDQPLSTLDASSPDAHVVDATATDSNHVTDTGTADAKLADSNPITDARVADVTDANIDAGLSPCHFVPGGVAATTITFPDQPSWSFHQEGVILRLTSDGTPHVVQFGGVYGAGTDAWGDPAMYAAEYDVSVWPPRQVQPPTRISDAEEGNSFAVVLPGNSLLFGWLLQADYGGIGPFAILYQMANATSWQLGAEGRLANNATFRSGPALFPSGSGFFLSYAYEDVGDASPSLFSDPAVVAVDGRLSSFALNGAATGTATTLWSAGGDGGDVPAFGTPWFSGIHALSRTSTTDLLAVYYADCGPEVSSAYCEADTIVLFQVEAGGAIQKVATVLPRSSDDFVASPILVSDAAGHTWLTWWEGPLVDGGPVGPAFLFAVPLTDNGVVAGPVESWFATDNVNDVSNSGPTVGSLGTVYPLSTSITTDAGTSLRRVHLIHRQLEAQAPVEDITFTTAETGYPAGAVQIAKPRSAVAGYSTYPPDAGFGAQGYAQLARYTCAEDAP